MDGIETYKSKGKNLIRRVKLRNNTFSESVVDSTSKPNEIVSPEDYDIAWLRSKVLPKSPVWRNEIRMVDLFSGT